MEGVHAEVIGPDCFRDDRAGFDGDFVGSRISRAFVVVVNGGLALRRNVLHQRSTEGNVEYLDATTDCEHRSAASACLLNQGGFGRIARGVH